MNLLELLLNLPLELYWKIRRMTYLSQPKQLLDDISHFHSSKLLLFDYYDKNKYIDRTDISTIKKSICTCFVEDIELHLNNYENPGNHLIKVKFKNTISRYDKYKNENDEHLLRIIIFFLYYHTVELEGNFLWGIMTIKERNEMISNLISNDNLNNIIF